MKSINGGLFFFFGSLRQGYWNNRILSSSATCLGNAQTVEPCALYIGVRGTVPTCVPGEGSTPLKGEVWELNQADARRVYDLETGYLSDDFDVRLADGTLVQATIFHHKDAEDCYYMAGGPEVVASGDYTTVVGMEGGRRNG